MAGKGRGERHMRGGEEERAGGVNVGCWYCKRGEGRRKWRERSESVWGS